MNVGDVVGFTCGQPGNDRTYILVEKLYDDLLRGWDLTFDMDVVVKPDAVWLATDGELDKEFGFNGSRRNGTFSIRQLADERRSYQLWRAAQVSGDRS